MAIHKKICWWCMAFSFIIGFITWGVTSCKTETKFEELLSIPIQDNNIAGTISRKDLGLFFSQQKSHNWTSTKVPTDIKMFLLDNQYEEVDYYFFMQFNNWFKKLKFENGIMPINQKENLDCDNFALLYKSLMGISSYKGSSKLEPAVAVMVVEQKNEFGGIPSGYLHMINLVFTNNGWYVIEAQTGKFIKLENYPNQSFVKYFIL